MEDNQIQKFSIKHMQHHWQTFIILLICAIFFALTGWGILSSHLLFMIPSLVPIALGIVLLGLWQSLIIALVFGIICMMGASGLESGELQVLFADPLVSIIPRLLCVLTVWIQYRRFVRKMDDGSKSAKYIIAGITAGNVVLVDLLLILVATGLFHSDLFGIEGLPDTMLKQSEIINDIISVRFVFEYFVSVILTVIVVWLYHRKESADTSQASMQKTIRKWLSLSLTAMAVIIFGVTFSIDTIFENRQAAEEIAITLENMAQDYEELSQKITYRELLYHLGQHGHTLLLRDNQLIETDQSLPEGMTLESLKMGAVKFDDFFYAGYHQTAWKCAARRTNDGSILVGMIPEYEVHVNRNRTTIENIIAIYLIIIVIYFIINLIIKRNVTTNVRKISEGLAEISGGKLNTRLNVLNNLEFSQISNDINETVQSLQNAQAEVNRHIQEDLNLAHAIQMAMLPPNNLKRPECEIAASYISAKEVGGDFYDYFELPNHRIGLVMADVSGKGIPAAMFMMTAKTIVKNISAVSDSPAAVLMQANRQLCENNNADMFVTLWLGFVDLKTRKLVFANAGHNPPILKHQDEIEFLDHKHYKRGLMLAAFESSKYLNNEIQLSKDDMLILYTDGITEACNPALELYGDERLATTIRNTSGANAQQLLETISRSVLEFENGMEQADDKTILVFE